MLPRPSSDAFRSFSLSTVASSDSNATDVIEYEGLNQTADWIFRGLVHSARCKVESEITLVEKNRFTFDKVMSFDFLQPVSATFDKNLIAHRDEFKFFLEHANGEQLSCNAEAFMLKSIKHMNSPQPTFDSLVLCFIENAGRSLMFPPFRKGHLVVTDYNIDYSRQTLRNITSMTELRDPTSFIKLKGFNGSTITLRSSSVAQIRLWKTYIDELFSATGGPFSDLTENISSDSLASENSSYHFGSLREDILSNSQKGLNIISPKPTHARMDSYAAIASFENNIDFMKNSLIDSPKLKQFSISPKSDDEPQDISERPIGNHNRSSSIDTDHDDYPSDSQSEDESILSDPNYVFSDSHNDSTSTLSKFEGINYTYVPSSSPILSRLPQTSSPKTISDESSTSTPVLEESLRDSSKEYRSSGDTLSLPPSPQSTIQHGSQNTVNTEYADAEELEPNSDHALKHRQSVETIKSLHRPSTPCVEPTTTSSSTTVSHSTTPTLTDTKTVQAKEIQIAPVEPAPISTKSHVESPQVSLSSEHPTLKKKRSTKKLFGAIKQFFKSKKDATQEEQPTSLKSKLKSQSSLSSLNNRKSVDDTTSEPEESQNTEIVYTPRPGTAFSLAARNDRCLSKISEEDVSYDDDDKKSNKFDGTPVIKEEPEESHSRSVSVDRVSSFGPVCTSSIEPRINSVSDSGSPIEFNENKPSVPSTDDKLEKTIRHSKSQSSVKTVVNVETSQPEKNEIKTPIAPFTGECETPGENSQPGANFSLTSYSGYNTGTVSQSSSISTLFDRTQLNVRLSRSKSTYTPKKMMKNEIIGLLSTQAIVSKWSGRKWDKLNNGFVYTNVSVYSAEPGGLIECKLITNENILTLKITSKTFVRRATFQDVELKGVESFSSFGTNEVFMFRFMNINDADEFANSIEACRKEFTSQVLLASRPSLRKMKSAELLSSNSSTSSSSRSESSSGKNSMVNRPRMLRSYSSAGSLKSRISSFHQANGSMDSDRISLISTKVFTPTLLPPLLSNKNIKV